MDNLPNSDPDSPSVPHLLRGTAKQNDQYVGSVGQLTIDTTNGSLRLHDGVTPGGKPISGTGSVTGAANFGSGAGQVYDSIDTTAATIAFKSIKAGANVTVTNNSQDVTIAGNAGTVTGGANFGSGAGQVYDSTDSTASTIAFKTIKAGTGMTVTNNAQDVTVTCTVTGTVTGATNFGTGTGWIYDAADTTPSNIAFKTIKAGAGIGITNNAQDVTIRNAPAAGSIGNVTLSGGTATVNYSGVTANRVILLTNQSLGGVIGTLRISARTAGTSFTITSTSVLDTSLIGYMVVEPT